MAYTYIRACYCVGGVRFLGLVPHDLAVVGVRPCPVRLVAKMVPALAYLVLRTVGWHLWGPAWCLPLATVEGLVSFLIPNSQRGAGHCPGFLGGVYLVGATWIGVMAGRVTVGEW